MPISIRSARAEDVPALAELAAQTFTETFGHLYSSVNLRSHLNKTCSVGFFIDALRQDTLLVACDEGKMIGYAKFGSLGLPVENPPASASEIHRLYVIKPYQDRKIGTALMQQVMENPQITQVPAVYLGSWENNHKARQFYQKYGFEPVGEYLYPVGTQLDREIIMARLNQPLLHCR